MSKNTYVLTLRCKQVDSRDGVVTFRNRMALTVNDTPFSALSPTISEEEAEEVSHAILNMISCATRLIPEADLDTLFDQIRNYRENINILPDQP